MTKQSIIKVFFCLILSLAYISKEIFPLSKDYFKQYACEIDIEGIMKNNISNFIKTNISEKEFDEFKKFKNQYCKPTS